MSENDLARRVARLEAREEIGELMAEYLYLADRDPDADKVAALFAEDGVWEPRGNFALEQTPSEGRETIRELFAALPQTMSFGAHYVTNAVIEIADDLETARGRWHAFELLTKENPTVELAAVAWYDNDFVRVEGRWRFQRIRFEDSLCFPFAEGWADTRFVSLVSGERFPHPGPSAA